MWCMLLYTGTFDRLKLLISSHFMRSVAILLWLCLLLYWIENEMIVLNTSFQNFVEATLPGWTSVFSSFVVVVMMIQSVNISAIDLQ